MQWLQQNGYTEMNFGGSGLIMSDLAIEFKQEVLYGSTITVELFAGELSRVSFDLYYQLLTEKEGKKVIAAKAKTGMVCYNYQLKKTVAIPLVVIPILQD